MSRKKIRKKTHARRPRGAHARQYDAMMRAHGQAYVEQLCRTKETGAEMSPDEAVALEAMAKAHGKESVDDE